MGSRQPCAGTALVISLKFPTLTNYVKVLFITNLRILEFIYRRREFWKNYRRKRREPCAIKLGNDLSFHLISNSYKFHPQTSNSLILKFVIKKWENSVNRVWMDSYCISFFVDLFSSQFYSSHKRMGNFKKLRYSINVW